MSYMIQLSTTVNWHIYGLVKICLTVTMWMFLPFTDLLHRSYTDLTQTMCRPYTDFSRLKLSEKLFVNDSMCFENHQLAYKWRKLKNLGKIHSTWFYSNAVNIKYTENDRIHKIFHTIDIEKLLDIDNWDEFLNR